MDIFATLLSLADVTPPADRRYDGTDATDILLKGGKNGHTVIISLLFSEQHLKLKIQPRDHESHLFLCSFSFTLTAALQGHLVTCKRFAWGGTRLSTSQVSTSISKYVVLSKAKP